MKARPAARYLTSTLHFFFRLNILPIFYEMNHLPLLMYYTHTISKSFLFPLQFQTVSLFYVYKLQSIFQTIVSQFVCTYTFFHAVKIYRHFFSFPGSHRLKRTSLFPDYMNLYNTPPRLSENHVLSHLFISLSVSSFSNTSADSLCGVL